MKEKSDPCTYLGNLSFIVFYRHRKNSGGFKRIRTCDLCDAGKLGAGQFVGLMCRLQMKNRSDPEFSRYMQGWLLPFICNPHLKYIHLFHPSSSFIGTHEPNRLTCSQL